MQTFRVHCLRQFSGGVALGADLRHSPVAQAAVVHRETVMMLRHGHHIFRSCFFEELCPRGSIEVFGFEHWNEILVAELVLGAVRSDLVLVFGSALLIHGSWIPFIAESRDGIDAPMNENPEFCVPVPFGNLILLKGFPVRPKRALVVSAIDLLQEGGASGVIFAAGALPGLINAGWVLGIGRGGGALGVQGGYRGKGQHDSAKYAKQLRRKPWLREHNVLLSARKLMACCVRHTSSLCPKECVPCYDDICRKWDNVSRSDGVTILGDQSHERSENCPSDDGHHDQRPADFGVWSQSFQTESENRREHKRHEETRSEQRP